MNEQELSQLLHEATRDVAVSCSSSPRTLSRTRIRMAANSVLALSLIVLVIGGGFTLANSTSVTGASRINPAGPITTPGPQEESPADRSEERAGADATGGYDGRLDCNKEDRSSEFGEGEMGVVPKEALQEWLDKKSIYWIEPSDFDVKRIGPRAKELSLSLNGNGPRMVARTTLVPAKDVGEQHQGDSPSSSEIDQWKLAEVAYCPDLMGP